MKTRGWIAFGSGAGALVSFLLVHRARTNRQVLQVTKALTILRPVNEVYAAWRNLEGLPRMMRHLQQVHVIDERLSHWVADSPAGARIEWDAELTEERENEQLAWRSLPGSDVEHSGTVQFRPAPANRGTEVLVRFSYKSKALGRWLAAGTERRIREDLRRFKTWLEVGEIPTTQGQPHGKRSAVVTMLEPFDREQVADRGSRVAAM